MERARAELLVREKAHTRAGDELAAARRRLSMTRMEPVMVVGPDGPVPLHDVFAGRRMLIVYHFMWKNGAPQLGSGGIGKRSWIHACHSGVS